MANKTAGLAPFERVVAAIRNDIIEGRLEPGARLPSNRELVQQQDASLPTVQKAIGLLQDEGWLVTRPSVGVFVADEPPTAAAPMSLPELRRAVAGLQGALEELSKRVAQLEER